MPGTLSGAMSATMTPMWLLSRHQQLQTNIKGKDESFCSFSFCFYFSLNSFYLETIFKFSLFKLN